MRVTVSISIILLVSSCVFGPLGTSKRAIKQLEKGNYVKSQQLVEKALKKDSLLPAALYTKAKLLLHDHDYEFYDSAYYFTLKAQSVFDTLDVADREKHIKHRFDSLTFQGLKVIIDSLSFERALFVNTENGYNTFLENYPTAKQTLLAKSKRDALAFAKAKVENTYQSYKQFMEQYPDAVQVPDAKRRYEKLYFDKSTADGRVTSFIRFLEQNPNTPYRREAEQKIFEVVTSEHSVGGYELFIKKYPNSHLRKKAVDYAYHVALETDRQLSANFISDSLRLARSLSSFLLIPVLEGEDFGFMDSTGQVIIEPHYKTIAQFYTCQPVYSDFLVVNGHLEGRNGAVISYKTYDDVVDLGYGLLKVKAGDKWGIIHKSGDEIEEIKYEQIKLINGNILAFSTGRQWLLKTVSGRLLVADTFEDIYKQGEFIIFEKDDHFEIKTPGEVLSAVDNTPVKFDFLYTDFEVLGDGNLWVRSSDGEMIVDENFGPITTARNQQVELLPKGFLEINDHGANVLNAKYQAVLTGLKDVTHNQTWLIGRADTTSWIYNIEQQKALRVDADSMQILGQQYLVVFENDSVATYFSGGNKAYFLNKKRFTVISSTQVEYLVVLDDGTREVYNQNGKAIIQTNESKLLPLGKEYFVFDKKDRKGVISAETGEVVLKPVYDAIGNYAKGNVALLKDKKFGLFNERQNIFIPPVYDKNIAAYNDSVFIVGEDGQQFLLSKDQNKLHETGYENVHYWNDTVAFVKSGENWGLFNLKRQQMSETGFRSFNERTLKNGERVAVILAETGYGVLSNISGQLVAPTFNDIVVFETKSEAVYFAEKHIKEAEFYVVVYYDSKGNIIRKQALETDEYFKIYCD